MNHCAEVDAASFILSGVIRNRTNTQNYKKTNKQTNSKQYILTLPISMCGNKRQ